MVARGQEYYGAGVLPMAIHPETGEVVVLLLRETRVNSRTSEIQKHALIDLGGKWEFYDAGPEYTAMREMNEESGNMYQDISPRLLAAMRSEDHAGMPTFKLRGRLPYYFYCVSVPYREPADGSALIWVTVQDLRASNGAFVGDGDSRMMVSDRLRDLLTQPHVGHALFTADVK